MPFSTTSRRARKQQIISFYYHNHCAPMISEVRFPKHPLCEVCERRLATGTRRPGLQGAAASSSARPPQGRELSICSNLSAIATQEVSLEQAGQDAGRDAGCHSASGRRTRRPNLSEDNNADSAFSSALCTAASPDSETSENDGWPLLPASSPRARQVVSRRCPSD